MYIFHLSISKHSVICAVAVKEMTLLLFDVKKYLYVSFECTKKTYVVLGELNCG